VTWLGSTIFEKIIFLSYKSKAKRKLQNLHNLQIIAVTGSYGKTSIKNFLFQILSRKFRVQTTPRSVNTIGGIVRDINENLLNQTEIYVVEAGARERGDILEIARFLEHHLAIVGKIGEQHIEYFKTIENILDTKLEIVKSKNLQRVYLHTSVGNNVLNKRTSPFRIEYFANDVGGVVSDIDGTNFNLKVKGEYHRFQTPLIGAFQAENLDVVVRIAVYYGFSIDDVREAILDLKPVENRLQKFRVGGKLILDDGYNGNLDGMLEAFRIVEKSKGRKIVVTPGLVESSNEQNERIAFEIDDVFDVVIITGSLNQKLFKENLKNPHALRIFLEDKSKLEQILSKYTNRGDIILFANDAPNFI
jgi:UDP-N-acetylmuramoyl-tripeptide--D-alanyl-D-alanine ligase